MKSEQLCRKLSLKVRYKNVSIHDQNIDPYFLYKPILSFLLPLTPFKEANPSSKKRFYFAGRKRDQILKRWVIEENRGKRRKTKEMQRFDDQPETRFLAMRWRAAHTKTKFLYAQPQDYRTFTLRSCNSFSRTQIKHKIIRPLLDFKRENITILCKDLCISVYPDKSNRLLQYSRNRIRKQIIPSIKYFLNPQVENSLFKIAELLEKEQSLLSVLLKTV